MGIVNITTLNPDYNTLEAADFNDLQTELETESASIDKYNIAPNSLNYKNIKDATINLSTGHSAIYGITTDTPTAVQAYSAAVYETIQDAAAVPSDLEVIIGDVNGIDLVGGLGGYDILRFEWKIQVVDITAGDAGIDPDLTFTWFKPQYEVDTGAGATWTDFVNGVDSCEQLLSGYASYRASSAVGLVNQSQEKYHVVSGSVIFQETSILSPTFTKCRMRIKQNQAGMVCNLRDIQLNVIIERKAGGN